MAEPTEKSRHPLIMKLADVPPLKEWRCDQCGKLLARLSCGHGTQLTIETRCSKCGAIVVKQEIAA